MNVGENRLGNSSYGRVVHCSDGCYDEDVDLPGAIVDGNEKNIRSVGLIWSQLSILVLLFSLEFH